jgi:hypothetical protein
VTSFFVDRTRRKTPLAWLGGAVFAVGAVLLVPSRARASDAEVHASSVSFDAGRQEVVLEGDVRVDSPPFHLRSEHVRLRRNGGGPLELEGEGRLAFCPCLGTPLAVTFQGAKVAPPGDLFLEKPVLEIFGLKVLWLPAFWLRAPQKPGLLPPDVAYRAKDGLYLGLGGHLPWSNGASALDLRGGVYTRGGGALDARFFARTSRTRVRLDHLDDTGVLVDARGFTTRGRAELSWDVDAIRGARGVYATTRVDEASKPWDRASAEMTFATSFARVTTGAIGTMARGGDFGSLGAAGPTFGADLHGFSRDRALSASSQLFGASLSDPRGGATHVGMARAKLELAGALGPLASKIGADGEATGLAEGEGGKGLAAIALRSRVGLPLARAFGDVVHLVEPLVTTTVGARTDGALPLGLVPLEGNVPDPGTVALAAGGRTSLGNVARADASSISLEATGGLVTLGRGTMVPGGHTELAARTRFFGVSGEGALVRDRTETGLYAGGHVRIGFEDGVRLVTRVDYGSTLDAFAARRLADGGAPLPGRYLATQGLSLGSRAVVPIVRRVTAMGGVDADLTRETLLGTTFGVELRDKCQCLVLRTFGSHRLGRDGVDVWITIDVLGDAPVWK